MWHILVSNSAIQALPSKHRYQTQVGGEISLYPHRRHPEGPVLAVPLLFHQHLMNRAGGWVKKHTSMPCLSWTTSQAEACKMLGCPNRPGIGGGVPKGRRQPVGAQLISYQSPRTPLLSGATLSVLASLKWGKEDKQPPHSPESSTASLGLAFTTYILCVHRFSLTGGHASCGEKKRL